MTRLGTLIGTLVALLLAAPAPAAAADDTDWGWPVAPPHQVVAGFDPPAEPWLAGHRGVDLAARAGVAVRAAGAGAVAFAGRVGGRPVVSIRHPGGLLTTYEPVVAVVSAGDPVELGERIGRLARTGSHCAPRVCLHWGLRRWGLHRDDTYLDPLALLGLTRVRLLPLHDGSPGGPPLGVAGVVGTGAGTSLVGCWWWRRRRAAGSA
jgi:murein DD-endopeptidase MepM/ murein hydrolase activator NlpD